MAALGLGFLPWLALAHSVGISRGEYEARGARLTASLTLARGELGMAVPSSLDGQGQLSASSLSAASEPVERWLEAGVAVDVEGALCPVRFGGSRLVEGDGVELLWEAGCPRAGALRVGLPLLVQLSPGHRHLAHWAGGTAVLFAGEESFGLRSGAVGALAAVPEMFVSGVRHALAGPEHWVLLLVLALMAPGWRRMLGLLGAFAVAHLAVMTASALGVGAPDARWVHAAMALLLGYLGLENWLAKRFDHRWALSALFGMVHAWALGQTGSLPAATGFTAGLVVGQLAILLALVPAAAVARRRAWFVARLAGPLSMGAAALGVVCVYQRTASAPVSVTYSSRAPPAMYGSPGRGFMEKK
jgi:hypothetical protein